MLSMPVTHPDIIEFINVKTDLDKVTKANISVMITDDFMRAVDNNEMWEMTFEVPDSGEVIKRKTPAKDLLKLIATNNWRMAEPGALFWDRVTGYHLNSDNPNFKYVSTNPCGEKPLPSGGSCLLGSINLAEYVEHGKFNFESFEEDVKAAVAYLDDMLTEGIPFLPLDEQKESVAKYRQIGLGTMGVADALILMGIRYGSEDSLEMVGRIGSVMANAALQESAMRAKELGVYPAYESQYVLQSEYLNSVASPKTLGLIQKYGLRNAELLSIAPTGSISTMLGVSGGIEPIFQISYTRKSETLNDTGDTYYEVFTPIAKKYMTEHGITDKKDLPDFFVTSSTLDYKERIDFQSVWQKYVDAAISSTVNVVHDFTVEQVEDLYMYAWKKGLKGVTIYRDGCERSGILISEDTKSKKAITIEDLSIEDLEDLIYEKSQKEIAKNPNVCPMCGGEMFHSGGCTECKDCAYSPCSI